MMGRQHRRFHLLLALIALVLLGYVLFWYYALDQAKQAFDALVQRERARGATVEFSSAEWGGFPVRLGVTLTDLRYAADGGRLEASTAVAEALPWNPTHLLARLEGGANLFYRDDQAGEEITLQPGLVFASVRITYSGALKSADVELRDAAANGILAEDGPFELAFKRLQLDMRFVGSTPPAQPGSTPTPPRDTYDVALSADQVELGNGFDPLLGTRISQVRFSARLSQLPLFSEGYRPLDRESLITMLADIGSEAEIARLDIDWGGVSLRSTGRLHLDEQHRPAGQVDTTVAGMAKMLDALLRKGVLEGPASAIASIKDGTPVSLLLKNGNVTFGPFTVGRVEPLR